MGSMVPGCASAAGSSVDHLDEDGDRRQQSGDARACRHSTQPTMDSAHTRSLSSRGSFRTQRSGEGSGGQHSEDEASMDPQRDQPITTPGRQRLVTQPSDFCHIGHQKRHDEKYRAVHRFSVSRQPPSSDGSHTDQRREHGCGHKNACNHPEEQSCCLVAHVSRLSRSVRRMLCNDGSGF